LPPHISRNAAPIWPLNTAAPGSPRRAHPQPRSTPALPAHATTSPEPPQQHQTTELAQYLE